MSFDELPAWTQFVVTCFWVLQFFGVTLLFKILIDTQRIWKGKTLGD